jgi:septal ring factor EnvC (AmiA/AmiB activator)
MKYWVFQNNQVLGPFEPDDLGRHTTFTAESLVCPEGRRGTSMGDWQRAGSIPDLSVALVRAAQAGHMAAPTLSSLAGLNPEPTLKDMVVLSTIQDKMSSMEEAMAQLQAGLRAKDAQLAALHTELNSKEREISAASMESTISKEEAEKLKLENDARRREADEFRTAAEEFKRQMSGIK